MTNLKRKVTTWLKFVASNLKLEKFIDIVFPFRYSTTKLMMIRFNAKEGQYEM